MPRKNPLPQSEQEICKRLKTFRQAIKFSRVNFARELQIDSGFLAAIEHCRAPLRYGIAYQVAVVFRINPEWLARGSGSMTANAVLLPPPGSKPAIRDRSPFSVIYEEQMSVPVAASPANKHDRSTFAKLTVGPDPVGRLFAQDWLSSRSHEWFVRVPASRLNEFLGAVILHGEKLLEEYGPQDADIELQLRQKMEALRATLKARDQMLSNASEKIVDTFGQFQVLPESVISNPPLNWASLRDRLNRVTSAYGSKSRLARGFNVTPQSVTEWLAGESSPTADTTLRLLAWVQAEEAKQQKTPSSVSTTARGKTRSTPSSYEKRKSSPNKTLPKNRKPRKR